jgi:hypothetical protein
MSPIVYPINQGINRPIEFRGLKAQYILYAAGMVITTLLLFIILFISGLSSWVDIPLCFGLGGAGIGWCYRSSKVHGEFGRARKKAANKVPKTIANRSRKTFIRLKQQRI